MKAVLRNLHIFFLQEVLPRLANWMVPSSLPGGVFLHKPLKRPINNAGSGGCLRIFTVIQFCDGCSLRGPLRWLIHLTVCLRRKFLNHLARELGKFTSQWSETLAAAAF
jgi:hypothetical protein